MLNDVVIANKLYAKMTISAAEMVDEISLKVLKQDSPDFLLTMKTMNIDGETELRFEIGDGSRLSYFNEKMSKQNFILLLKNMLMPYKNCSDWFLDYHNILLNFNYIILKNNDYSIKYIYIPKKEKIQTDEQIIKFFEDFVIKIEIVDEPAYTIKLLRVIKENSSNLMALLDVIMQDLVELESITQVKKEIPHSNINVMEQSVNDQTLNNSSVNIQYTDNQSKNKEVVSIKNIFNKSTEKQQKESKVEVTRPGQQITEYGKKDVEGELINSLFGEEKEEKSKSKKAEKIVKDKNSIGRGLFGNLFKKNTNKAIEIEERQKKLEINNSVDIGKEKSNNQNTQILSNIELPISSETEYIGEDYIEGKDNNKIILQLKDSAGYAFPPIIKLDIEKGYVTVGRADSAGTTYCDYNFNSTLSFISRRHFRIQKEGEQMLQIIDTNSKNGTYLNDKHLVPNMPYLLSKGDIIMISSKYKITYMVL